MRQSGCASMINLTAEAEAQVVRAASLRPVPLSNLQCNDLIQP